DAARMRANLELTLGLIQAEAVAMELAHHLGKSQAHALVEAACRRVLAEGRSLGEVLREEPSVTRVLAPEAIARCLSPEAYLGAPEAFVERVLQARRGAKEPEN